MKFYRVTADRFAYDQYDEFIVAANNKKEARKVAEDAAGEGYSEKYSQTWTAKEFVMPTEPGVVLGSFNAG